MQLARVGSRLALGEHTLRQGDEIEVLWNGRWMRGTIQYCDWCGIHRLNVGAEWMIEIRPGMSARYGENDTAGKAL